MTTRQRTERTCDICGKAEGVRRYRIEFVDEPRRLTADLCIDHQGPLEEISAALPSKGGGRLGVRDMEVVSEAHIKRARAEWRKRQKAQGN